MSRLKCLSDRRLPNRQAGLTLAELMIGLALSLFLMVGVVSLFVNQKSTYRTNIAVSEMQDMGRAAVEMISFDMRMVGFQGCADTQMPEEGADVVAGGVSTDAVDSYLGSDKSFQETALQGFETGTSGWSSGNSDPALTELETGDENVIKPLPGTDVFVARYGAPVGIDIIDHDDANSQFIINNDVSKTIPQGALLLVSDCDYGEVIARSNEPDPDTGGPLSYSTGNQCASDNPDSPCGTEGKLLKPYSPADGATLRRFVSNIYFVGPTGRSNPAGEPINALFVKPSGATGEGAASELIAGVDNLQVVYGYLDGSNQVRYLEADDAALDMRRVVSARIGLLLSSNTPVLEEDDSLTYVLAGQPVEPEGTTGATLTHPVDKKLRRAFNVMVPLRNRWESL